MNRAVVSRDLGRELKTLEQRLSDLGAVKYVDFGYAEHVARIGVILNDADFDARTRVIAIVDEWHRPLVDHMSVDLDIVDLAHQDELFDHLL